MDKPAVRNRSAAIKKSIKGKKSPGKFGKRMNEFPSKGKKVDNRMKKLFRKRARDYNSDDDDLEAKDEQAGPKKKFEGKPHRNEKLEGKLHKKEKFEGKLHTNEDDYVEALGQDQASDDEDIEIQPGVTKFAEGCRAFRMAFLKIMKRHIDEELGPVLSAHKKLVVAKLAEEESERKVKSEAKKEKQMVAEKGHVKPANFLDSHEKFLIGVATKGVVKLFNAVNKAQNAQKGLDPSRTKDAKVLRQRRKQVFFSELSKASGQPNEATAKASEREQPSWGPLRDTYMLTAPKLKDWDKTADATATDDIGMLSEDSSDDDE